MTPQQLKQKSKEIWQQSQKKLKSSPAPASPPQRLQQNLQQWKDQAVAWQQQSKTTTAVNNTGGQLMKLTKAQELCIAQFKAHHQAWNRRNKRYSDITMARHYRLTSASMALYLFVMHTQLYQQATSALRAAGKQYPNPLTSAHGCMATNPKFITILHQELRQPKSRVRMESKPLRGESCSDPATFFFPPQPPPAAPAAPAVPIPHVAPVAPLVAVPPPPAPAPQYCPPSPMQVNSIDVPLLTPSTASASDPDHAMLPSPGALAIPN
jgi:hypothetical protein